MEFVIYTDGSTRGNGSPNAIGAWGYIVVVNNERKVADCQVVYGTTNQKMELEACIQGCNSVMSILMPHDRVRIITDSAYVHNCYSQKWYVKWRENKWLNAKRYPVSNKEQWERLIPFFENPQFYFEKTKGHADDIWNNHIDEIVQKATREAKAQCQE